MSLLQRKQSQGPRAPRAVPRPPRRACRSSLGPGGRGAVLARAVLARSVLPARARARVSVRLGLRESHHRERTVRCRVFIPPSPLGLLQVLRGRCN